MCTGATHEWAAFSRYRHYSISRDPAEAIKREIAIAVLDTENIAHEIAVGLVRTWLRFKVQEITLPVMIDALENTGCLIGMMRRSLPPPARCANQ
jgi:hypothetical protein